MESPQAEILPSFDPLSLASWLEEADGLTAEGSSSSSPSSDGGSGGGGGALGGGGGGLDDWLLSPALVAFLDDDWTPDRSDVTGHNDDVGDGDGGGDDDARTPQMPQCEDGPTDLTPSLPPPPMAMSRAPRPPRRPATTTRDRRRAELAYLRERVTELEGQLERLRPPGRLSTAANDSEESRAPSAAEAVRLFWERVARRQARAREHAVLENQRLRDNLRSQIRIIRGIDRLLRRRVAVEPPPRPRDDGAGSMRLLPGTGTDIDNDNDDASRFARLLVNLEQQYAATDAILQASGVRGHPTTFQAAQLKTPPPSSPHSHGEWFLEFVDSRIIPFSVATTSDVAWRVLATPVSASPTLRCEVIEATPTILRLRSANVVHVREVAFLNNSWFALRRFIEPTRVVVVWNLHATIQAQAPVGLTITTKSNPEMTAMQSGWGVMERLPGADNYTLSQSVSRLRTDAVARLSSGLTEHAGLLTEMILASFDQNLSGYFELMETQLMEQDAAGAEASLAPIR